MQKLAKVLLVDDDPTTSFLHSHLLSALEVAEQLLVARNGVEAFQTLEQLCAEPDAFTEPLLVLLDVNMPVMNGIEFLETYQQHPLAQKCQLVIVVLSSSEHSRDLERIKALPIAADILPKPLTREKVETILHRHFRQQLPA
ncbi:MAG: response regulator [Janthinobacterium lividum]